MPRVRKSETINDKIKAKRRPGAFRRSRLPQRSEGGVQRGAAIAVDGLLFLREMLMRRHYTLIMLCAWLIINICFA